MKKVYLLIVSIFMLILTGCFALNDDPLKDNIMRESINLSKDEYFTIITEAGEYSIDLECEVDGDYLYTVENDKINVEDIDIESEINYNKENSTLPDIYTPYIMATKFWQEKNDDILTLSIQIGIKINDKVDLKFDKKLIVSYEIPLK